MPSFEITWSAPEFEYREKDVSWYWVTIMAAAAIIAFAVWERNFLFGFFIMIAEVLVIAWGNRMPRPMVMRLTESDLSIGSHTSHSLKEFESWSADGIGGGFAELAFNFRAKFRMPLKLFIPEEQLDEVRSHLKLILREVEHQTSLIEAIERWLKF